MTEKTSEVVAVIATLGRAEELAPLLQSLGAQSRPADRIVIVDQNTDTRLEPVLAEFPDLPLCHLRNAPVPGVNRNRNLGWKQTLGDIYFFPDDDCWYPADFIERALSVLNGQGCDIVSGRASAPDGRSINGRFLSSAAWVDRENAWFTQIEWVLFLTRAVLEQTGGFDERIGPGAGTPWGANEVQDLSLAALQKGFRQYYDPALTGHHAEFEIAGSSPDVLAKGKAYARGFGYVLRKHGYGWRRAVYWALRPAFGACLSMLQGSPVTARYQLAVASGRLEGYWRAKAAQQVVGGPG
jgi:glycosyltransferase involved in cell wall biosynthesis